MVDALALSRFSLVVHDYGGAIALPLALQAPERIRRLVLLNTWMWSFEDDPSLRGGARLAGSWLGRLAYRYLNASLQLLMPRGYADRRRLTPELHRHYLAPFREPEARERVLWTLACSLLGSREYFQRLWQARSLLSSVPSLMVWGLADTLLPARLLERWREALPHARFETFTGAGHWPHEECPERVLELLDHFLPPCDAPRDKLLGA